MEIVSACPLPVSSIVWQARSGGVSLTVVCKATFALAPVESSLAEDQDPVNEADLHWNDDPRESLRCVGDLVPFKSRAEVLLVGHAHAPRGEPVRSLVARLCVGEVDKAVEIFADRVFAPDGQIREGPRFAKSPLLWHYASGGPGTANPVGVRREGPPDRYGQRLLPRLQPPGLHVTGPGDYIPPVGFGPISPTWPERWSKLYHHGAGWDHRRWYQRPLPEDIHPAYFNAAPADQQLATIRAGERIILENLHPQHPRLVTTLAVAEPRAVVAWGSRRTDELRFVCDTMWIDTDRGRCSLTWRALVPLEAADARGRITVSLEAPPPPSERTAQYNRRPRADTGATLPFLPPANEPAALPWSAPSGSARLRSARPSTLHGAPVPTGKPEMPFRPRSVTLATIDSVEPPMPFRAPLSTLTEIADAEPPTPRGAGLPFLATPPAAAPPSSDRDGDALPLPPPPPAMFSTLERDPEPLAWPSLAAEAPTPPPLLGPRLVAEPIAAPEAPTALTSLAPPPPAIAEPIPLPLDRYPLARCAAIAASRARTEAEAASILVENELPADVWGALEQHWAEAMRRESERGRTALLDAYDRAYVDRLEDERGPITVAEHARMVLALERGRAPAVLAALKLPRGATLRIQRVFLHRMAADAAFGKSVRAAIETEAETSDGEE